MADRPQDFDILIVGGGPAGMAAASAAAGAGTVGIVDDNPSLGGQIWRGQSFAVEQKNAAAAMYRRVQQAGVTHLPRLRVLDAPRPGILLAESEAGSYELRYRKLVLATGARERFLPFPGWTQRNVMGAGGLQAMVKSGLPIPGKRVVVAGSGPLLLAVAAYLHQQGAQVVSICEQSPFARLAKFSFGLFGDPRRLAQGVGYRMQLRRTPYRAGCWPIAARGTRHIESVVLSDGHRTQEVPCDYLACGFHLVPNIELPALLGCELLHGFVRVDEQQQTSVPGIYCAGEPTGIGGLEQAILEGEIAGLVCSGRTEALRPLLQKKKKFGKFADRLARAFALRPELRGLANAETILCRCEDVSFGDVRKHSSWRAAKLHTRCGMGPCQGRICGAATEFLFGWNADSVRPPIFPMRFGTMVGRGCTQENKLQER